MDGKRLRLPKIRAISSSSLCLQSRDTMLCFRFIIGAVALGAAIIGLSSPVLAQSVDMDDFRDDLDEAAARFGMGLEIHADIEAAAQAVGEADGEQNIVYEAETGLSEKELANIEECVAPAAELAAAYSVAITDVEPESHSRGMGLDREVQRVELDEEKYAEHFIGRHAPPPEYDGKPQLKIVFNIAVEEWAYALGDNWGNAVERVETQLEERVVEASPSAQIATMEDDVCGVVDAVESFLDEIDDDDVARAFDRRELTELYDHSTERVETDIEVVERVASDWKEGNTEGAAQFREAKEAVRDHHEEASQALDDDELKVAREHLRDSTEPGEELYATASRIRDMMEAAEELRVALDDYRQEEAYRARWFVPGGPALDEQLEESTAAVVEFEDALGSDGALAEQEQRHDEAGRHIEELETVVEETGSTYRAATILGALGFGVLLFFAGRMLRGSRRENKQKSELMAEFLVDDWTVQLEGLQSLADHLQERLEDRAASDERRVKTRTREGMALILTLLGIAEDIAGRARKVLDDATLSEEDKRQRIEELMESDTICVDPSDPAARRVMGRDIRRSYEFVAGELLDELDEQIRELQEHISESSTDGDGESDDEATDVVTW